MTYWIIAIVFFVISAGLLIYSFFIEDNTADIQEEVEEITLNMFRDMTHIRKRLALIEDKLNIDHAADRPMNDRITTITENQIIKLYTRGRNYEGIAEDVGVPVETVTAIINNYISEGAIEER